MLDMLKQPTLLDLDDIVINGGTQPRAALNQETIAEYAEALLNGDTFPPVVIFYDGKDHWLADGFHRYHAHRRAEFAEINADIRQGTRRDAVLYSVGANADHGLRRTNEDKRRAVLALLEDEEWNQWSNREIARRCRVDEKTVRSLRDTVSAENPQIERKVERNGTVYTQNTANIGATKQQPERSPDEPTPWEQIRAKVEAKREAKAQGEGFPIKRPGQDDDTRLAAIRKVVASQPDAETVIIDDLSEGRRGWYHETILCYCEDTTPEEWQRIARKYIKGLTVTQPQPAPTDPKPSPMAVHFSSDTPEHYTPPAVIAAVVNCLGAIDLDPCSNSHTDPNVPADQHYTQDDNGLAQRWAGNVYMNPPYGREIGEWVLKLVNSYETGNVPAAIALVPARTDTQWWQVLRDYPVCLVSGRLKFGSAENSAPFPSAIFYLGNDIDRFYHTFSSLGDIWQRIEPGMFGE